MLVVVIGFLFANSAMSANWVIIKTDRNDNTYSIDTTRIKKVQTRLSTTGDVRSTWIKMDLAKAQGNISFLIIEEYTKCKEKTVATNTVVSYGSDGMAVDTAYNVSGSSVDFAKYVPILPGSLGESLSNTVCSLTAY